MKLKGFTMAEMLLMLGVLGIIAVLTMPALMNNILKQQVGPALIKAMGVIGTADELLMQEHEIYSFRETCSEPEGGYVANCFEPYLKQRLGAAKDSTTVNYTKINDSNSIYLSTDSSEYSAYSTKNGVTYIFGPVNEAGDRQELYIDVNGLQKRPNAYGKDLFKTVLNFDDGRVYAFGSRIIKDSEETWENGKCDNSGISDLDFCAGSVFDNAGKVIYPWS